MPSNACLFGGAINLPLSINSLPSKFLACMREEVGAVAAVAL